MRSFVARFIPRYFASWPLRYIVPGSKFTYEVSLENLCRLEQEKEDTSNATCESTKTTTIASLVWYLECFFFIFY